MEDTKYCRCKKPSAIATEMDDFGHWDVCCDCGKAIEFTYEYFNHFDGEDHDIGWE